MIGYNYISKVKCKLYKLKYYVIIYDIFNNYIKIAMTMSC